VPSLFTYELPIADSQHSFDLILTVNLASGELLLFGKRV